MFILAFIAELIVNANWATVPHWALVITGVVAAVEALTYIIAFGIWGTVVVKIIKDWRDK